MSPAGRSAASCRVIKGPSGASTSSKPLAMLVSISGGAGIPSPDSCFLLKKMSAYVNETFKIRTLRGLLDSESLGLPSHPGEWSFVAVALYPPYSGQGSTLP